MGSARDRARVVAAVVLQAHHDVEAALVAPHLADLASGEADLDGAHDVARREAHARGGGALHLDAELREAVRALGAQVGDARDAGHRRAHRLAELGEACEIRAEDPHREIGGRAAQALVDAHAERRRDEDAERGHGGETLAHVGLDRARRAAPFAAQEHEHVRDRVRHGVLGALGAAGAAHDVDHLGNLAQHVLDAVVQAVDLVQRGLGGERRLDQQRALVHRRA